MSNGLRRGFINTLVIIPLVISLAYGSFSLAEETADFMQDGKVSLTLRDIELSEVMEILSRAARVNILLAENVEGKVSFNLYDISIEEAIHSIAMSAGYAVEQRNGSYFIVDHGEVGKYAGGGPTRLQTFKVQYSDPETVAGILQKHLSSYGEITTLTERRLIVVEDTPHFLARIGKLLKALDREPKQILIEAHILEVGLKDSEAYGLDWSTLFQSGDGTIGTQGLASPGAPGLFLDLVTSDVEVVLNALRTRDRLRTLSTPKLLTLEGREAETIIGDRLGYNVTTTIDNVTTTSTEFLESGVILRVKTSVDEQNRVLLDIHPEVSTGSVTDDGIPNQTTTEVTTSMLVESGQTVFIGGLIKRTSQQTREGIPVLGDIPGLGLLFSNRALSTINTELVVLITPYIIDHEKMALDAGERARVERVQEDLEEQSVKIEQELGKMEYFEDIVDDFTSKDDALFYE